MKVVLATGIYPPDIGGPATYVLKLAEKLVERGVRVVVVTYEEPRTKNQEPNNVQVGNSNAWPVIGVSKSGGPYFRWRRYAKALKQQCTDADIVYAFSSVSAGAPIWFAKIRHAKKILRLGGDFLWERYTDRGGTLSLKDWYASNPRFKSKMNGLLRQFDHLVFSSAFQEELYERFYARLPLHNVIENALPGGVPVHHLIHSPMKLLFLGRFVSFKNLGSLIIALKDIPDATLTIVGSGPLDQNLRELVEQQQLTERITFLPPHEGDAKQQLFLDHDLLVLPSYTEISPNTALEARAAGLPVLLTEETGLSRALTDGTALRPLRSPQEIVNAVRDVRDAYELLADRAAAPIPARSWDTIAEEHMTLFRSLL
jgi:glycosyltransferase involved in cell wall biosynthesis